MPTIEQDRMAIRRAIQLQPATAVVGVEEQIMAAVEPLLGRIRKLEENARSDRVWALRALKRLGVDLSDLFE